VDVARRARRARRALGKRIRATSPATYTRIHRVILLGRVVRQATRTSYAIAQQHRELCLVYRRRDGYWVHRYREGVTLARKPRVGPTVRQLDARARDYFLQEYVPRPGDTVVDVGAGVGAEMHLFSSLVGRRGRLYAIEAHPKTYAQLLRTCRANRTHNVEPVQLAITDQPGEIVISDDQKHIANTVMRRGDGLRVPADTLDGFVEARGIARIDFLKMNIEGAERLALKGMRKSIAMTDNVCICCHDFLADRPGGSPDMRTKELVQRFLVENGFDIVDRAPEDRRPWSRDYVYGRRRAATPVPLPGRG
jgi:FkbM family methyltransferase